MMPKITYSDKSRKRAFLWWIFFGIFGGHRFYLGKISSGLLYTLTLGFFTLGWLYDGYLIITNNFYDNKNNLLKPGEFIEKTVGRLIFRNKNYLQMQKRQYENAALKWTPDNPDHVVGHYNEHNNWSDYDNFLFKDIDTSNLIALDFGTGPGRNIIKFNSRFYQIDGVDIAQNNLSQCKINLNNNQITNSKLYLTNGQDLSGIPSNFYDVVFSTITFQHIAVHSIRFNLFREINRVLKKGGYFCFQMGYGGRSDGNFVTYFKNFTSTPKTNGFMDVSIMDEKEIKNELLNELQYKNYQSDLRPTGPGDKHKNWIFIKVQK